MVGNILGGCLFESILTIWCSSLLEDARLFFLCKIYTWLCAQVLTPCALPVRTSPLPIVIEVGRLWRCLDLLEVTSISSVSLSLSLSMFAVAQALTSLIHDCIE